MPQAVGIISGIKEERITEGSLWDHAIVAACRGQSKWPDHLPKYSPPIGGLSVHYNCRIKTRIVGDTSPERLRSGAFCARSACTDCSEPVSVFLNRRRFYSGSQSILWASHVLTPAARNRIISPFWRCTKRRASATCSTRRRSSSKVI